MQNQRVNIAAVAGMGGVGKTELAWQYAQRRGDAFPGGVCWLRGVEPIAAQIVSFALEYLDLRVPEQTENPVAYSCQRWPGEGPVLMVIDDVQDYGALKAVLPSSQRFRVLLTTRRAILPVGQRLALEVLVPGAALELLESLVGATRIEAERVAAEALCEWVGRLPLGIELVGWYLQERSALTIEQLLARLAEKRLAAKALIETHPEMTAELGIAAAFEVSWEPLTAAARKLAGLFGLFAAAPVKLEWVQAACERAGIAGLDEEGLEDAVVELRRMHLLQEKRQEGLRYQVHPLVREFFAVKRANLSEAERLPYGFAQSITEVAKTIPQTVTVTVRTQIVEAVPHLEEVALRWSSVLDGVDKIWCCIGLARFFESLSQWEDAERCHRRSLEISQAELGDRHPNTATSLNNLATMYYLQGRYTEAEPFCQQALDIRRAELGEHHSDTATSMHDLALLYKYQGCYEKAELLYLEALNICEAELGRQHPDTATVINDIAALYEDQGRYEEAEPLYLEALNICEAELGRRHHSTAVSLKNLAALYNYQGRYEEAEPLYLEALNICEAELGKRHPTTALILNNLAGLYEDQGRYEEAEPLYLETLDIRKAELGERHPRTAVSLNNLAGLYRMQGRYEEAEPLYVQTFEICETELGECHPFTVAVLNNIGRLHCLRGCYGRAEPLYIKALTLNQEQLGNDHPNTAYSLNGLAEVYRFQERYDKAEPLYIQALKIRKERLGKCHPETAESLFNLALLHYQTQRSQQALTHIQQAISIYVEALGTEHPKTEATYSWLQLIQQAANKEAHP